MASAALHKVSPEFDDIVDQDAGLAGNVADNIHNFRVACAFAALIDNGERRADAFCQGAGAHHAADIGGNHHDVMEFQPFLDVPDQDGRGV